jgi:capsule polysaccharide export protein KpsE/RkpR
LLPLIFSSVQEYNLISVVRTLHTWRKPLFLITAGAAVISALLSLTLPTYYKASTVFYAASQDLFKPQKVFGYTQSDMYYYGGSEDIERLLTAATSHEVLAQLINEFGLYEHYRIRQGTEKSRHRVQQRLLDLYKISRTKYDAIEISIEDRDPELAAKMANRARDKINEVITGVIKGSQKDLIVSYREAITLKEHALVAIEDSLRKFQEKYGIYDPEAQSEFLSTLVTNVETRLVRERAILKSYKENRNIKGAQDSIGHLTARIAGLEQQRSLLTGVDTSESSPYSVQRFSEGMGRVELYDDAYRKAINALNIDREIVKQMEAAIALNVTAIHLIEEATVPVVKSRPRRSVLVIAVTFAAFVFSAFALLLYESVKEQDWSFLKW